MTSQQRRSSLCLKSKKKNIGNKKLCTEIDKLITDLEKFNPREESISDIRNDADCVHSDGFYRSPAKTNDAPSEKVG